MNNKVQQRFTKGGTNKGVYTVCLHTTSNSIISIGI